VAGGSNFTVKRLIKLFSLLCTPLPSLGLSAFSDSRRVKRHWEIVADNLSKAGCSWGCVSAIDSKGRTIWIADAHRGNGRHKTMNRFPL
jgi:hypothetical protein